METTSKEIIDEIRRTIQDAEELAAGLRDQAEQAGNDELAEALGAVLAALDAAQDAAKEAL